MILYNLEVAGFEMCMEETARSANCSTTPALALWIRTSGLKKRLTGSYGKLNAFHCV